MITTKKTKGEKNSINARSNVLLHDKMCLTDNE